METFISLVLFQNRSQTVPLCVILMKKHLKYVLFLLKYFAGLSLHKKAQQQTLAVSFKCLLRVT